MATEKAQMDLLMQKEEADRKVSSLVAKLRAQRMSLEIAKEGLAEMSTEYSELQGLCYEMSHELQDSRCSSYTSQRTWDQSQSLGDTGGEESSQGSRRSAAGTEMGSKGNSGDASKLVSRIRKLEAELVVSQTRSDRIAGLEDEMEAYTAMQDEKIQEMQYQVRDLHSKLEAERQRNEQLAQQHAQLWSSISVERSDLKSSMQRNSQASDRFPGHGVEIFSRQGEPC